MRVSGKTFKGLFAVVAVVFVFSSTAVAEPVFDVSAGLSADWKSDSNFYRDNINPKEVYTYTVSPNFSVSKETANLKFLLDYALDANFYRDQDSLAVGEREADDKDYLGHNVNGKILFKPIEDLDLGLDVAYAKTLDPKQSDSLSHSTDDDEYDLMRVSPIFGYRFGREGRFSYNMRYRNSNLRYANGAQEGSEEHRGIFELGYELTAATSVGVEYQVAKMDYAQATSDYLENQIKAVVGYEIGFFSLEFGAGVNERDLENSSEEDIDTGVYHLKLAMEGSQAKIALGSEYNFNNRGPGSQYYTAHKVTLDMEYIYAERLPLALGGYYQESDYENLQVFTNAAGTQAIRKDYLYDIHGSVGYKLTDWITFNVKAGYEDKRTNALAGDYDNTYVLGSVSLDLYPR